MSSLAYDKIRTATFLSIVYFCNYTKMMSVPDKKKSEVWKYLYSVMDYKKRNILRSFFKK